MTLAETYTPVGIPEIDDEHKQVLQQLQDLATAASGNVDLPSLLERAARFAEKLAHHFAAEEALMSVLDAADRQRHTREHRRMIERCRSQLSRATESSVVSDWASLVAKWLIAHHVDEDLLLGLALLRPKSGPPTP